MAFMPQSRNAQPTLPGNLGDVGPPPPMPLPPMLPPNATPGDVSTDPQSPTTLVLNYLRSKGIQPGNPNYAQAIRTAVEENARNPGTIPGLTNMAPTDAGAGGPQGGSGAGAQPTPKAVMPPGITQPTGPTPDRRDVGSSNTSAPPSVDNGAVGGSGIGPLGMSIAAGIPLAALGYGASKIPAMGGVPTPGASVPPPVDPGAIPTRPGATPGAPGGGPGEVDYTQLVPPEGQVTPFDTAMNRAVPGSAAPIRPVGPPGSMDMTPPRGPIEPVAPQMPPLVSRTPPALTPEAAAAIRNSPTLGGHAPMPTVTIRPRITPRFMVR